MFVGNDFVWPAPPTGWGFSIGEGDEKWWGTAPSQFNPGNVFFDHRGTTLYVKKQMDWNPMGR